MSLSSLEAPATPNLPKFLAKTGYENPADPNKTNFMDKDPEGLNFFQRLAATPATQHAFSKGKEGLAAGKADWTGIFETESLLRGFDLAGEGVFVVELGGSNGQDISRLLDRHPKLPAGSLVLQDLPGVLQLAKVPEKITVLPHDFFTPQPIRGLSPSTSAHELVRLMIACLTRCPGVFFARLSSRLGRY